MKDWEKFNEKPLPEKEECYSNLNMKDITDADFRKMCLNIYHLDLAKFLSAPGLASSFKKDWIKIKIINWYGYAINAWKRH